MKKLLFITPSFPKDDSESYMVCFLQHVFHAFVEKYKNVEVTIISTQKPISTPYYWHGIKVIPLNGNNIRYPFKIIFLIKSFYKINRLKKENKYDGILNLWYNDFSVYSHLTNQKTYSWMLGQDVKRDNIFLRLFKPDSKKIIAISNYSNNVLYESIKIKAHKIIPIAVNKNLFPELNTNERSIDVFGAGWLSPLKNYSLFLDIILELKNINPNIKVEIAGIGTEESKLKEFVKTNQLEKNVTFLGLLSHKEILLKMNNSKIFLHTSTFEGGPTVYYEALYSGCQLVGTLQTMDRAVENFYCANSKKDILITLINLLENPKKPKRVIYYSMDYVCEEVYNLFYS
ncbi:glycosyltransferase [uncultured Flavobacterium sp.]|uniref:glycosyltransferase family 4 protein n=1 Tax=uncultured Flavobacterium sp. TaxID=165435 RepID=UPI0030EE1CD5|tara:strand:+ start:77616 stop:78647 length:1032 start_codon:yes stop_codon:yes gene_type:complete